MAICRLTGYTASGEITEIREWIISEKNPPGMEEDHIGAMLFCSCGRLPNDSRNCVEVRTEIINH